MVYLTFQKDVALEQRIGADCLHNLNQRMLLLKSPVDAITKAIVDVYPLASLERDAYDFAVKSTDNLCIVFQLRNQSWEIIQLPPSVDEESLIRSISRKLEVAGMMFEQSDTSNFINYRFFNSGELLEVFEFRWDGIEGEEFIQGLCDGYSDVCTLEFSSLTEEEEDELKQNEITPPSATCRFKSCLRHLEIKDIKDFGDPFEFVSNFFKEKNIYAPAILGRIGVPGENNLILRIKNLSINDFERFSCVLLPKVCDF